MLDGQLILQDEKCFRILLGHRGESALEISWTSHLVGLKCHAERTSGALCLCPGMRVRWISRIPKQRRPKKFRDHLLEQFETFRTKFGLEQGAAGNVPAGMGEAGD